MKLFRQLSNDINGNIEEARDKIKTAYALKSDCPEAAQWYKEMASAHINFNSNGIQTIKKRMEAFKSSEEYKRNSSYADGMIAAWEAMLTDIISRTTETKAMVDGFK